MFPSDGAQFLSKRQKEAWIEYTDAADHDRQWQEASCLFRSRDILAVFDDHGLGSLGDFAVLVPGHI